MIRRRWTGTSALLYYILGRLVLGAAVALLMRSVGAPPEAPYFVAAALALTSLEGLRIVRGGRSVPLSVPGILLTDFILETYVILQTGAHQSPFVILYGFTVLFGGLLLALKGGLILGTVAAVASSVFVWLLPAPVAESLSASAGPAARTGLYALFFIALGGASGSLAALERRKERQWLETTSRLEQTTLEAETILSNLPMGVLTLGSDGRVRNLNPAAREILGTRRVQAEEAPASLTLDDIRAAGAGPLVDLIHRALAARTAPFAVEFSLGGEGPDEESGKPVEAFAVPIVDSTDLRGVAVLIQDLTERKRLEAQTRRQDRLAALGTFSAGLAHEIRNSLKPITGSAELLASLDLPPEALPLKDLLMREAEALEGFLEDYLDFARDKTLQITPTSIDGLVREELRALECHALWTEGMRWELRAGQGETLHPVDSNQLRRALRNILNNALEATTGPSVIRVGVQERSSGVRIRVRDWGCGMDRRTLDNVGTPLFTTKARGTGLGLCYSRRIVERHGGTLSVISRPGKGTLITVDLPPADIRDEAA